MVSDAGLSELKAEEKIVKLESYFSLTFGKDDFKICSWGIRCPQDGIAPAVSLLVVQVLGLLCVSHMPQLGGVLSSLGLPGPVGIGRFSCGPSVMTT